jgi:uncharacterized protein (DUF1697 family)
MALVVFLRGINVGGHRSFRPSLLARALSEHDVVNVGAAGTFVVRKPPSRAKLRADLQRAIPFEAEIVVCEGRDLQRFVNDDPFGDAPPRSDVVRFVSVLAKTARASAPTPITLPPKGEWLVRVLSTRGRFVFGVYRRRMKTIGELGKLDDLFGAPATTRSWSTMLTLVRILNGERAQ